MDSLDIEEELKYEIEEQYNDVENRKIVGALESLLTEYSMKKAFDKNEDDDQ